MEQFISKEKTLIFGAGEAGRQLQQALINSRKFQVMFFLDDDKKLDGLLINQTPIIHPEKLEKFLIKYQNKTALIAIPSASKKVRNSKLKIFLKNLMVRTLLD